MLSTIAIHCAYGIVTVRVTWLNVFLESQATSFITKHTKMYIQVFPNNKSPETFLYGVP